MRKLKVEKASKVWFSQIKLIISIALLCSLPACVTQNFSEDKPVVERDFSNEQIAQTRISLALGYLKMGNTTAAKLNLEKAKKFAPNLIEVYTAFAHYYETVGELDQTESAYLKALSIEKNDANTLNNFGVFLCRQNRVDEAEKYFLKAIKVPTYIRVSESYENIALCHLKENNFDRADWALERSIAHSPNSASSLLQMAQLKYAKGDYTNSVKFINRYELTTRRFSPSAIALAYKANKKLGNNDIADSYSRMLLSMFPDSIQARDFIDNELYQIEADILALEYRKYKLLQSGVKINKKPIIAYKKSPKRNDGLKQSNPSLLVKSEKLVKDSEIIASTGNSIKANSQIESKTPVLSAKPVPAKAAPVRNQPVAKSVNVNSTQAKTAQQTTAVGPAVSVSKPITPSKAVSVAPGKVIDPSATSQQVKIITNNNQQVRSVNKPAISSGQKSTLKYTAEKAPVHIVQAGDNLFQISKKYNITISTIRRWNDLKSEDIKVGQILRLTKPE